jgi:hypothetical protein
MDRLRHCYGTGGLTYISKEEGATSKLATDGRTEELQIRYKSPTKTPKNCSSGSTLGVFLLWWWCAAAAAAMCDPRQISIATSAVISANLFCHLQVRCYVPQRIIDHSRMRFRAWWAPPAPLDRLHECVAIGSWTHAVPDGRTDGRTDGLRDRRPTSRATCRPVFRPILHLSIFLATQVNHV